MSVGSPVRVNRGRSWGRGGPPFASVQRDEPGSVGDDHGLGAVAGAELGQQPGDVGTHGLDAEEELRGDFRVGQALRDEYAEITPGYHMNKRHWVSVRAGEALSRRFVRELVVDSYRLVLEKLPRSVRPVDPETYGG